MRIQLKKYGTIKLFACTVSVCLLSVLFLFNDIEDKSFAKPDMITENTKSTKKECFIKSLSFFNQSSWNEAMDISNEYQTALNQFHVEIVKMLQKEIRFGGGGKWLPNPQVRNEDAMISQLGIMYSGNKTFSLSFLLLEKIDQKRIPRFPVKNRHKLFFQEGRPAYDALVRIGPTAAFAAKEKIGQEPNQEKRRLMAQLLWKVLGKKFALLYLEDENLKVVANEKLSTEEKETYQAHYREAISQVTMMESK